MSRYLQILFLLGFIFHSSCTPPESATFFVEGNCNECKELIERKLTDISGVKEAQWDFQTSMATILYRNSSISIDQVQETLSQSGFNTQYYPGDNEARKNLPACCTEASGRKFKPSMPAHP